MSHLRLISSFLVTELILALSCQGGFVISQETPLICRIDGQMVEMQLGSERRRVRIDEAIKYKGETKFVLGTVANVHRFYFADTPDGKTIRRLVVVQCESILPENRAKYDYYNFQNAPTFGDHRYIYDAMYYSMPRTPDGQKNQEVLDALSFFSKHRLEIADEVIQARFLSVVGPEQRNEFIVVYLEPLAEYDTTVSQLDNKKPGGSISKETAFSRIKKRAAQAIEFLKNY